MFLFIIAILVIAFGFSLMSKTRQADREVKARGSVPATVVNTTKGSIVFELENGSRVELFRTAEAPALATFVQGDKGMLEYGGQFLYAWQRNR